MEIEQGERYLVVGNGYGEAVELHEIVVVELHDKFAKTLNVITGGVQWRYVTDLVADAVAALPPLPGQPAHMRSEEPIVTFTLRPDPEIEWQDTEVGALLAKTKNIPVAWLRWFYNYCQDPRTMSDWLLKHRKYEKLGFTFDGTIESYLAIRPRLCEIYGIGPKTAASYDAVLLGTFNHS